MRTYCLALFIAGASLTVLATWMLAPWLGTLIAGAWLVALGTAGYAREHEKEKHGESRLRRTGPPQEH